jgi:hypothetical protein
MKHSVKHVAIGFVFLLGLPLLANLLNQDK